MSCDFFPRVRIRLVSYIALAGLSLAAAPGCIVIPVGDLLRGPLLAEQVLIEGAGFFAKEKVALIEIEGLISGDEGGTVFNPRANTVAETKARLQRARRDPEVRAVVLRISSPGGEVTACDVIHHEILKFKKDTGIPVVASIGDRGASGGYYVAMAADVVFANPTAIVGSIGVILQHFDISELLTKIGVHTDPIKSAERKDLNSPLRKMTEGERGVLQKVVDDLYQRFVEVVVQGRPGLKREDVLSLADGRVVSGTEAAALKLVDRAAYLTDAISEARERGEIESPTIVHYTRVAKSGANIYAESNVDSARGRGLSVNLELGAWDGPRLYYLWQPGS
ncbi:MAG TPA: signal peptide peptidase SppA [Planctomycetota bacterium]|nr:signal peptide peptidase SppA [Planctomycetota bacterium]